MPKCHKKRLFPPKKRAKSLVLHQQLFVHGIKTVRYALLELLPTCADIVNRTYCALLMGVVLLRRRKGYSIAGLAPKNKWTILLDRKNYLNLNTLITAWLQTSALVSTGKEKDYEKFWNLRCQEISKRLWLPTETDSAVSHLNLSN